MAIQITVPRLGWSMDEGTFSSWLRQPGEMIRSGEVLFAVESDKVTMDVESLDEGILYTPPDAPEPGAMVTAGQRIGFLLAEGEAPPLTAPPPITPRARGVARELGVDTSGLAGSGRGGRIRERDVREAFASQQPRAAATPMRRAIAARMVESRLQTAPVTLMRRADATELVRLRDQAKSYTAIVVKLCGAALHQHPALASRWEQDRIVPAASIDIGIAVDTPAGLFVPVIRDVPALSIEEVARRSQALIEAAHNRRLAPDDLDGGVFSVTNLGAFGIEAFTPILNYPQSAVLGMGAIGWEVVALGQGQIATRQQITLSLTFDHRVTDGAPAARFLQTLVGMIENPGPHTLGRRSGSDSPIVR